MHPLALLGNNLRMLFGLVRIFLRVVLHMFLILLFTCFFSFYLGSGAHYAQSLLGGYDEDCGPSLYFLDYLGSLAKVNHGVHGYAAYFSTAVLDKHWKANMSLDEGKQLLRLCAQQLSTRYSILSPKYRIFAIGKEGKILDEIITGEA